MINVEGQEFLLLSLVFIIVLEILDNVKIQK